MGHFVWALRHTVWLVPLPCFAARFKASMLPLVAESIVSLDLDGG